MASPRNEPTVSKASSAVVSASSPLRMKSLLCTMRTGTVSAARESGSSAAEVCRSVNQPRTVEAIVVSPASPNSGVCTSRKKEGEREHGDGEALQPVEELGFLIHCRPPARRPPRSGGWAARAARSCRGPRGPRGEGAVLALDDVGGDGQAETRAAGFARARLIDAVEALEDAAAVGLRDADAVVRDLHPDPRPRCRR